MHQKPEVSSSNQVNSGTLKSWIGANFTFYAALYPDTLYWETTWQGRFLYNVPVVSGFVAKKTVSWLRFSSRQSPFFFFAGDLEQNFHPQSFATPWMQGYHTLCLQDGACSTWKENMLNKKSKHNFIISITLLIIVALILKVVRNWFWTFHLDRLIWLRYQMIASMCVT